MGLDNAIPCWLLITELVTNAFKYAFPAGMPCTEAGAGSCEIAVSMQWDGAAYTLVVADNGVGLPAGLDWTKTKTLGRPIIVNDFQAANPLNDRKPGICHAGDAQGSADLSWKNARQA